jgi:hypothetical protein
VDERDKSTHQPDEPEQLSIYTDYFTVWQNIMRTNCRWQVNPRM